MPDEHPDRLKWNVKYANGVVPSFTPHPLALRALSMDLPDGLLVELACGPSGAALLAAANGRPVMAVDVSEVALGMLGQKARRHGLDHLITLVQADLLSWQPDARSGALVLCTGFWDSEAFAVAAEAVTPGASLSSASAAASAFDLASSSDTRVFARLCFSA